MTTVVEAKELTKSFGDTTAVDRVGFRMEENKIYG
jgi:ABC-type multidrug transport system ATPase subunit